MILIPKSTNIKFSEAELLCRVVMQADFVFFCRRSLLRIFQMWSAIQIILSACVCVRWVYIGVGIIVSFLLYVGERWEICCFLFVRILSIRSMDMKCWTGCNICVLLQCRLPLNFIVVSFNWSFCRYDLKHELCYRICIL